MLQLRRRDRGQKTEVEAEIDGLSAMNKSNSAVSPPGVTLGAHHHLVIYLGSAQGQSSLFTLSPPLPLHVAESPHFAQSVPQIFPKSLENLHTLHQIISDSSFLFLTSKEGRERSGALKFATSHHIMTYFFADW